MKSMIIALLVFFVLSTLSVAGDHQVSQDQARATVLLVFPGVVKNIDYDAERDGTEYWEFEIRALKGDTVTVKVDSNSGLITEIGVERTTLNIRKEYDVLVEALPRLAELYV